jgi:hypothetical protein
MSKPYGVISDSHNHAWSAFATTLPSGVNSRLQTILDETWRAAEAVKAAGGYRLFHAGDLFHVRGNLAPSVLNPTMDLYRDIHDKLGVQTILLAGNHDLEGRTAEDVSSAITAMRGIGCQVVNTPSGERVGDVVLVPWHAAINELKDTIDEVAAHCTDPVETDLIIHAPVDGVIKGLPDHGLDADWLLARGFRRVLAGHYHHHKQMAVDLKPGSVARSVYSIGATTHQTWSDIGSQAGFLIVDDDEVKWHSTNAPRFVEIDGSVPPADIPLVADGNYVRITINSSKSADVEATRQFLMDAGALGVVVLSEKTTTGATRTGATYKAGTSIEQSIGDYIKAQPHFAKPAELQTLCQDILTTVRSVA